jgi:hypothetical protein
MTTTRELFEGKLEGVVANIITKTTRGGSVIIDEFRLNLCPTFYGKKAVIATHLDLPIEDFAVGDNVALHTYNTYIDAETNKPECKNHLPVVDGIGRVHNLTTNQEYSIPQLNQKVARAF